jgi:hypothetical protein
MFKNYIKLPTNTDAQVFIVVKNDQAFTLFSEEKRLMEYLTKMKIVIVKDYIDHD